MNLRNMERITTSLAVADAALMIVGLLATSIDNLLGWHLMVGNDFRRELSTFLSVTFLILLGLSVILNFSILTRYVREFVQAYLDRRS